MTDKSTSILARKLKPAPGAVAGKAAMGALPPEMTPSRALRTALSRAAAEAMNLPITVLGISIEPLPLDELLAQISDDMGLLWLHDRGEPAGFVAADPDTRAVLIEKLTTGLIFAKPADKSRKVTRTDTALMVPLIDRFLADLPEACMGSVLQGWSDEAVLGGHLESMRQAGLVLADTTYRLVRMTLDFGVAERQGELAVALPVSRSPRRDAPVTADVSDWADDFRAGVLKAPASLRAVLHRYRVPLKIVQEFEVGAVLPLAGVTVASIQLEGPGNKPMARARLGQMAGLRAVRIEAAGPPSMQEAEIGAGYPAAGAGDDNPRPALQSLPNRPLDALPEGPAFGNAVVSAVPDAEVEVAGLEMSSALQGEVADEDMQDDLAGNSVPLAAAELSL